MDLITEIELIFSVAFLFYFYHLLFDQQQFLPDLQRKILHTVALCFCFSMVEFVLFNTTHMTILGGILGTLVQMGESVK